MLIQRFLLAALSCALIEVASSAVAGLLFPGTEPYVMVACGLGLLLSTLWTRGVFGLAVTSVGLAFAAGWALARWSQAHDVALQQVGLSTLETGTGMQPIAVLLLVVSCFLIGTLCGWMLFHAREPWPVAALVGSCLLLRADVSLSYGERFPVFLLGILFLVGVTFAGRSRVWARIGVAGVTSLIAVAVAWALPTSIPAWSQSFMDPLRSLGTGAQVTASTSIDLRIPFRPRNQAVMSITLARPHLHPYWWRQVFDHFDGHSWAVTNYETRPVLAGDPLSPQNTTGAPVVSAVVRVLQPTNAVTFPGAPVSSSSLSFVMSRTGTREPLGVVAPDAMAPGTTYSVTGAARVSGSTRGLGVAPVFSGYLQIPPESKRVHELAKQLASTPDILHNILNVQDFLADSGRFHYDALAGSPANGEAVDNFLFVSRRGFCNQFATAMAILLREVGIPSRLIAGYATGTRHGSTYLVTDRDAHSWVEAYVPTRGWVQFEPTPGFVLDPRETLRSNSAQSPLPSIPISRPVQIIPPRTVAPVISPSHPVASRPHAHRSLRLSWQLGLAVLAVLCTLLFAVRVALHPRTPRAMYRRLARSRLLVGHPVRPSETPLQFGARVSSSLGGRADAVLISELYARERYGTHALTVGQARGAAAAWKRLSWQLLFKRLKP